MIKNVHNVIKLNCSLIFLMKNYVSLQISYKIPLSILATLLFHYLIQTQFHPYKNCDTIRTLLKQKIAQSNSTYAQSNQNTKTPISNQFPQHTIDQKNQRTSGKARSSKFLTPSCLAVSISHKHFQHRTGKSRTTGIYNLF